MWEKNRQTKTGFNQSQVIKLAFFSLFSILLTVILSIQTFAQSGFKWENDNIIFNNQIFVKTTVQNSQNNQSNQTVYLFKNHSKAHVLSFESEPQQAKRAKYIIYDINAQGNLVNPQKQPDVKLIETSNSTNSNNNNSNTNQAFPSQSQSSQSSSEASNQTSEKEQGSSSCNIEGIGWILCPVLTNISKEMDKIQAIIAKYMEIKPIDTKKDSVIMRSWRVMRNVANSLFIIVFLIIIFSYITNYGISSYNIKKMFPKLIVGAILVNVSIYLCVIIVDITNIIGGSIVGLFRDIQSQALGAGGNTQISWFEYTKAALAGGSLVVAGTLTASFAFGGAGGIVLTLLAAIVGAVISLVLTVTILAARQAIVLALVIIAPVAFVANLMPNTEIYFKKWFDIFKNMMLLLPTFSFIYGSAQLAGWIIISSAQDVLTLLLGMIVQVIPLLIIPKLVKDSDSILSKVGDGFNKTLLDPLRAKSSGYFNRKIDEQKARYLAETPRTLEVSKKLAQVFDKSKRMTEERTAAYGRKAEANYLKIKTNTKQDSLFNRYKSTRILGEQSEKELENAKLDLKISNQNLLANMFESIKKSKDIDKGLAKYSHLERELAKNALYNRIKQSEDIMATGAQAMNYNQMLQNRLQLKNYRGKKQDIIHASTGIFDGKEGSEVSVISKMLATTKKEYQEELSNYKTTMNAYKLSTDDLQKLVMGDKNGKPGKVIGVDDNGNKYEFDGSEAAVWEAAANKLFPFRIDLLTDFLEHTHKLKDKNGNIVEEGKYAKYATQVANIIRDNGLGKMAAYLGNVSPELIEQGKVGGSVMQAVVLNQIVKGRFSPNEFINQDKDATEKITKFVANFDNMKFDYDNKFNNPEAGGYAEIGFGIDNLSKNSIIEGFQKYLGYIKTALDPQEETFRQLKDAQVKQLRKLEIQLDETIKKHGGSVAPDDIFPEGSKQLEKALKEKNN